MNRRQFLKSCVVGLGGAVAIPSCLLPEKSPFPPEVFGGSKPITIRRYLLFRPNLKPWAEGEIHYPQKLEFIEETK